MWIRDGPLENLLGGGRAKYKKKIRDRENYMKKNSCTPINPKKYSYKEFDNEKKILAARKFPSPPYNFSFRLLAVKQYIDATSTYFC